MGSFSSRPKQLHTVTDVDRAVLSLKTQKRKLADYQKKTYAQVEREQEAVRQWVSAGNRERALLALKKRKIQEDALSRADAWILKIEQQLVDLETATRQAQVVESLKVGQAAMAELQKEMNLDDVEKLMDQTADSKAHLQEVQEMLDARLSPEEEAAVLEELQKLEEELGLLEEEEPKEKAMSVDAPTQMPSVPLHTQLPSVPAHTPSLKETPADEAQPYVEGEEELEQEEGRTTPVLAAA